MAIKDRPKIPSIPVYLGMCTEDTESTYFVKLRVLHSPNRRINRSLDLMWMLSDKKRKRLMMKLWSQWNKFMCNNHLDQGEDRYYTWTQGVDNLAMPECKSVWRQKK